MITEHDSIKLQRDFMPDLIQSYKDYLDYIEEHYNNVQHSYKILLQEQLPLNGESVFNKYNINVDDLSLQIAQHDYPKLYSDEFNAYRKKFFPTPLEKINFSEGEIKDAFNVAWEHHKKSTKHHWQSIKTQIDSYEYYLNQENSNVSKETLDDFYTHIHMNLIEMVCDWVAMGLKFDNNAIWYYDEHREEIGFDVETDKFIETLFYSFYDSTGYLKLLDKPKTNTADKPIDLIDLKSNKINQSDN